MSIKKLAKSINNLADAIRYHADGGATSASMTRIPITGASHGSVKGETSPQPLTEAEENFVDPYDAPPKADHTIVTPQPPAIIAADAEITISAEPIGPLNPRVNDPKFMAGFDAGLVPAFQTSDGKSLNDTTPPPKNPPLVVERDETPMVDPAPMPTEKPELSQEKPGQVPLSNAQLIFAPGWQTLTVEELDEKTGHTCDEKPHFSEDSGILVDSDTEQAEIAAFKARNNEKLPRVDADGLPWDERIHSGGKTLLVDGTWRLKRGVPDDEYQEVVAELKKLMAIPTPVDNTPPPPPSASAPVPPAPSTTVDNFPAFIKAVTGAQLDKDVVLAAVKNAGLENVMQLGARPDLIAGIAKELGL